MIRELEHMAYEESLKDLGFSLEKIRLRAYLTVVFSYLMGRCEEDGSGLPDAYSRREGAMIAS